MNHYRVIFAAGRENDRDVYADSIEVILNADVTLYLKFWRGGMICAEFSGVWGYVLQESK